MYQYGILEAVCTSDNYLDWTKYLQVSYTAQSP